MLTKEASNAVLKTLEEPPEHVVFVLCTTEMQAMLPTIRSRCQRFVFDRPGLPEIATVLHRIAQAESIEIEPAAIAVVARAAAAASATRSRRSTSCPPPATNGSGSPTCASCSGTTDTEVLFRTLDLVADGDAAGCLRVIAAQVDWGRRPGHAGRPICSATCARSSCASSWASCRPRSPPPTTSARASPPRPSGSARPRCTGWSTCCATSSIRCARAPIRGCRSSSRWCASAGRPASSSGGARSSGSRGSRRAGRGGLRPVAAPPVAAPPIAAAAPASAAPPPAAAPAPPAATGRRRSLSTAATAGAGRRSRAGSRAADRELERRDRARDRPPLGAPAVADAATRARGRSADGEVVLTFPQLAPVRPHRRPTRRPTARCSSPVLGEAVGGTGARPPRGRRGRSRGREPAPQAEVGRQPARRERPADASSRRSSTPARSRSAR